MRDGRRARTGSTRSQKAWTKDHFNVRVFNTLNLYEQTIATAVRHRRGTSVFNVRYPKDEKAILERYVPRMLGEAWGSMKARYDFAPTTPVQVELYANREQFSVRTSGLPNIGIEGVCFGARGRGDEPEERAVQLGQRRSGTSSGTCSRSSSRRTTCRAGSPRGSASTRRSFAVPSGSASSIRSSTRRSSRNALPGAVDMNRAFTHAERRRAT